jgi:hypothetical protein
MLQKLIDLFKSHRAWVGGILAAAATWAGVSGCPLVLEQNVPALLHLSCSQINLGIGALGYLLFGAGFFHSDQYHAAQQADAAGLGSVPPPKP